MTSPIKSNETYGFTVQTNQDSPKGTSDRPASAFGVSTQPVQWHRPSVELKRTDSGLIKTIYDEAGKIISQDRMTIDEPKEFALYSRLYQKSKDAK